jgi:hypothetical protein
VRGMKTRFAVALVGLLLSGCSTVSSKDADLATIAPETGRITVWAKGEPQAPLVLESDSEGVSRIDASKASAELISLLGVDTGEYVATDTQLWVRATGVMLRAKADPAMWVPVPKEDTILSSIGERAFDPFSVLFSKKGYFAVLAEAADVKWEKGRAVVQHDGGSITMLTENGEVVRVENEQIVATIEPLGETIEIPEQKASGEAIGGLFAQIANERNIVAVANIAISLHKAAIGFQAMQQSRESGRSPDLASISSRNIDAILASLIPPPGVKGPPDKLVKVSSGTRARLVWDGASAVARVESPVWMQVESQVGTACVRLGVDRGALGVAEGDRYVLGLQIPPAELEKDRAAWALVALAPLGEPACSLVKGAGSGW